jgi:hypothetical protein
MHLLAADRALGPHFTFIIAAIRFRSRGSRPIGTSTRPDIKVGSPQVRET